jgi:hypothetical protein
MAREAIIIELRVQVPDDVPVPMNWAEAHRIIRGMGPEATTVELVDARPD